MRLLLVRHGETALNAARVLQPPDTPLSERGHAKAAALARRLAAEPIARHCGVAVEPLPQLQERNYGELRGRAYDTLGFAPQAMNEAPPGGESTAAFDVRVDAVLARALEPARGTVEPCKAAVSLAAYLGDHSKPTGDSPWPSPATSLWSVPRAPRSAPSAVR